MAVATLIIKAVDQASGVFSGVTSAGEKAADAINKSFGILKDIAIAVAGIGIAATTAFGVAVVEAGKFETALTNTMTMTGLSGKAYNDMADQLSKVSIKQSEAFGIKSTKILESYYMVLSTGVKAGTEGFYKLSEAANKLSKVTGLETARSVEALGAILKIFSMDAKNAGSAAEVLFRSSMQGLTTVPELAEAMKEAGKAAAAAGYNLNDTAAALVALSEKGIKGAEAGTALRAILTKLQVPTDAGAIALKNMGVQVYDASGKMRPFTDILSDMQKGMKGMTGEQQAFNLKAIAGEEAFAKLQGLLSGSTEQMKRWAKETREGTTLTDAFAKIQATLQSRLDVLGITLANTSVMIGEKFGPQIAKAIDHLTNFIAALRTDKDFQTLFTVLSDALSSLINQMPAVIKAVLPILTQITKFLTTEIPIWIQNFKLFYSTMQTVFNGIVTAIQPFLTQLNAWWPVTKETWDTASGFFKEFWNDIVATVGPVLTEFVDFVVTELKGMASSFSDETMINTLAVFKAIFMTALTATTALLKAFFNYVKNAWTGFKMLSDNVLIPAVKAIGQTWEDVGYGLSTTVKFIGGLWQKYLVDPYVAADSKLKSLWAALKTAVTGTFNGMYQVIMSIMARIEAYVNEKITSIMNKIQQLKASVFGSGAGSITEAIVGGGATSRAYSSTTNNSKSVVVNVGTLVGDSDSLRELERKMAKYADERNSRSMAGG
jgi:TP901 family phage tail tape measure protein